MADDESFARMFEAAPKVAAGRRYRVGDVHDLEVVRVTRNGVFLALDGKQEGVVDTEELLGPDGNPTVRVGSRIAARVVEIDRATGSVRLSPLSSAPIVENLAEPRTGPVEGAKVVTGMRVKGKVTAVERYGVFLELPQQGERGRALRGLVPTAELGVPRGADLRKSFPLGTELEAVVSAIDERGRIRLSVVALRAADERRDYETYVSRDKPDSPDKERPKAPGFGTFADLMKRGR